MKTPLCISLLALLASAAFAADPPPAKPDANPKTEITGKATVTIEVNGQKVTREIDLGKATTLKFGDVSSISSTIKSTSETAKPPAEIRTWLGVISDEPSADARPQLPIPNGTGLLIRDVYADSPAAKAGLEKNDILVRLDDQILTNPEQLRALTGSKMDGDTVHVTYLRKGREATVDARLASHAEEEPVGKIDKLILGALNTGTGTLTLNDVSTWTGVGSTSTGSGSTSGTSGSTANPLVLNYSAAFDKDGNLAFSAVPGQAGAGKDGAGNTGKNEPVKAKAPAEVRPWLGVFTDEPSDDVRAQLPIPNGTGLLLRSVVADSPAAKAGLEKNDVLVRLDDQILANTEQFGALIRTKKEGDTVHVAYLRKGHEASAEAKLETHADEDAVGVLATNATFLLNRLQNALSVGDQGKVLLFQNSPGSDKAAVNAQWSLFTGNVQADVTEQINKLDKTLRDAGLNDEAIAQAKKAVAEAVGQVQKALTNAGANKTPDDAKRTLPTPTPPASPADKAP